MWFTKERKQSSNVCEIFVWSEVIEEGPVVWNVLLYSRKFSSGISFRRFRQRNFLTNLIQSFSFCTYSVKGAVSRYSVIFCAFFARAKNGGCSRKCRAHQTWKLGRPRGLAAWPGHQRWLLTWQCREPTTSRARAAQSAALLHLSTATGSTFVFRLRGPSKVISPSSRFKISSDSYIDIDSLFSCLVLRALRSLLRRSRRREHGWLGEGIGSVVVAPFPVTLTMCEGKCAERGTSSRNGCRRSCRHRPLLWHSHSTQWQRLEDSRNALVVGCGDVQVGDRGLSKEMLRALACRRFSSSLAARRCTFEHCTSCCPSRDGTVVALTKKKYAKRRLPLHERDLLRVGANVGSEMFSQVRSLAADRVSPPAAVS